MLRRKNNAFPWKMTRFLYCKTGFARGMKERFHKKERGSKEKGLLKKKVCVKTTGTSPRSQSPERKNKKRLKTTDGSSLQTHCFYTVFEHSVS
jgi:hypothetical protein